MDLKSKFKHRKTPQALLETANLLLFKPDIVEVNQVWYSDITFVKTGEDWPYLGAVMDAYLKRIVGYAMAEHMCTKRVVEALRMAAKQRGPIRGLIHPPQ